MNFKNKSLKVKLISAFLLAGLVPMLSIGMYAYYTSSSTLRSEAEDKLVAVRNIKGAAVQRYFQSINDQMITFTADVMVQDAMKEFTSSFNAFSEETNVSQTDLLVYKSKLKDFYVNQFGAKYQEDNGVDAQAMSYLNQLSDNELALQYHYIANNSNPLGSKEVLDSAPDGSSYSNLHAKYHPSIRTPSF